MKKNIYDFKVKKINGTEISLSDYKGKALLLVNVASECGLTPQYEQLEKIYDKYKSDGLVVLGFPANEFGAQEPGTNAEIEQFCVSKFAIKFPMFEKIVVKGNGQHPLYTFLTSEIPNAEPTNNNSFEEKLKGYGIHREMKNDILWNFEKFLINKNGEIVARFSPDVTPQDQIVTAAIEKELSI